MFTKILVGGLAVGVAAYLLRDKIAEGLTALEGKLFDWLAEDPTPGEDEGSENHYPSWTGTAPVPSEGEGYPVGKRGPQA